MLLWGAFYVIFMSSKKPLKCCFYVFSNNQISVVFESIFSYFIFSWHRKCYKPQSSRGFPPKSLPGVVQNVFVDAEGALNIHARHGAEPPPHSSFHHGVRDPRLGLGHLLQDLEAAVLTQDLPHLLLEDLALRSQDAVDLERHLGLIVELVQPSGPLGLTGHGEEVEEGKGILVVVCGRNRALCGKNRLRPKVPGGCRMLGARR